MSSAEGAADRAAWVRGAAALLAASGWEEPRSEAELLWCRASGEGRSELALRAGEPAPAPVLARLQDWLPRFARGEPLAYLEGRAGFHGIELLSDARALAPRADSEAVVELCLASLDPDRAERVADLGTGSGCLLLALLHQSTRWRGWGFDRSAPALALASANARRLALAERISFACTDWLEGVRGPFNLIVSNPPYVEPGEPLGRGVAEHEPHLALFTPEQEPLHAYRRILARVGGALASGGTLVVEIGCGRGPALRALADALGWRECGRRDDLAGIERAVAFRRAD